jgi:uncharacterized membrane protein
LWTLLGASLRLANLDGKPPWTEEFRTLVLSLGNSFKSVPLDRVIPVRDLLAPLIPNPSATLSDAIARVAIEDRQPPIYFSLAYLWMKLFPIDNGLVNLWGARALPAVLGTLMIPCMYVCSYLTFRWPSCLGSPAARLSQGGASVSAETRVANDRSARTIAICTAAMLAVSPYGIFISQEARHYSLAILWVTISISCLAIACRYFSMGQKLPILPIAIWVGSNILGMGTHYFFSIVLIAEVMALGLARVWQMRQIQPQPDLANSELSLTSNRLLPLGWPRLSIAILVTAAGVACWWWLLASNYDRFATAWIDNQPHKLIEVFNPFFQVLGASISMLSLLFVEVTELPQISILSKHPIDINIPIVFLSAILMLIFFVWVTPMLNRGLKMQLKQPSARIGTIVIASFTMSAIGLFLVISWLTGIDITRGARYHFVYFPGIMVLVGLGLASCWRSTPSIAKWVSGKQAVTIVLAMGLVSSAIVANNYGYHKYYRPEQIVPMIQQSAPIPVLIATTHNSLVQVGEMMGLAWEMRRIESVPQQFNRQVDLTTQTQFLLISQFQKVCDRDCHATKLLRETVDRFSRSIDLWLINFYAPVSLPPTCERSKQFTRGVYGYQYQLYHCRPLADSIS